MRCADGGGGGRGKGEWLDHRDPGLGVKSSLLNPITPFGSFSDTKTLTAAGSYITTLYKVLKNSFVLKYSLTYLGYR